MGNSQINAFHEPTPQFNKSKVKEILCGCGIFKLWCLTYNKSLQRNKTEIFELKIVSRSQRHAYRNFPEFECSFVCSFCKVEIVWFILLQWTFWCTFYLGSFWFSLVGPRPRPWLSLYWTVILWSSFEWRYLQGHSATDWILYKAGFFRQKCKMMFGIHLFYDGSSLSEQRSIHPSSDAD